MLQALVRAAVGPAVTASAASADEGTTAARAELEPDIFGSFSFCYRSLRRGSMSRSASVTWAGF
jgi:hypothetical protein